MQTVFSHIVQKRFSRENEDVATDALSFILESHEVARSGMMRLLRGIAPDLPELRFRTQQMEGSIRPDMWGYDVDAPRVYIENKFWAGLTDQQPVAYLEQLARYFQPTVLLFIVPVAREQSIARELLRRLSKSEIAIEPRDAQTGLALNALTASGPLLAVTNWSRLISILELDSASYADAMNDIRQLQALCEVADSQAFVPVADEEVSDQRTPAFMLQLGSIVQKVVESAITRGIIDVEGLRPQASWDRIGRYIKFTSGGGVGAWFGVRFDLWKSHGGSPLWLVFSPGEFSRAGEVRVVLEPWAANHGSVVANENGDYAVGIDIPTAVEEGEVVDTIMGQLTGIADLFRSLASANAPPA